MKIADFPFDDYVLFSNGSIVEAMWLKLPTAKARGFTLYHIKSRYKALYMSNDKKELQNLQKKIKKPQELLLNLRFFSAAIPERHTVFECHYSREVVSHR